MSGKPAPKLIPRVLQGTALVVLVCSSCLHDPQAPSVPEYDVTGFISAWETLEAAYPLFEHHDLNWMDMAQLYYASAIECTDMDELLQVISDMVGEIEDPAMIMYSTYGDTLRPYGADYETNVSMDVLINNYLQPRGFEGIIQGFGRCDPEVFPYACFEHFPSASQDTLAFSAYDEFIAECVALELPAIIIDIRMNPQFNSFGGILGYSKFVMGRLVTRPKVSAVYRYRCGPRYGQLLDSHPWIQPAGDAQYDGTVYLLTGGACNHSAEDMAVNLGHFDNFILVGDTTAGDISFTGQISLDPESMWFLRYGFVTVLTHEYEWVQNNGIPPDVFVETTEADFSAGIDPVLEYVIDEMGY